MRSLSFLLASTLLAVTPLGAQSGRIPYDTFSLANGLKVIYSEDHSAPIVSVDLWYEVGSRNERTGRSGFAHLFEHMMFQGSAHVKKAEHNQLLGRAAISTAAPPRIARTTTKPFRRTGSISRSGSRPTACARSRSPRRTSRTS